LDFHPCKKIKNAMHVFFQNLGFFLFNFYEPSCKYRNAKTLKEIVGISSDVPNPNMSWTPFTGVEFLT